MIDLSRLWVTEWVAGVFFTYLTLLAVQRTLPVRHQLRVLAVAVVCTGLSLMLSQMQPSPVLQVLREWIPSIYLMQGYWLCGLFFQRPMTDIERRLIDVDRVLFRTLKGTEFLMRGPRVVLEYFELTYLLALPGSTFGGGSGPSCRPALACCAGWEPAQTLTASGPHSSSPASAHMGCFRGYKPGHPGPSSVAGLRIRAVCFFVD